MSDEAATRLQTSFRMVLLLALRIADSYNEVPADGGPADPDWLDDTLGHELWGRSPALAADLRAMHALRAAADHGLAAAEVLVVHPFAALTLNRAVLEASAVSAYLSDPDISYLERCRRSVNEQLHSLYEQARMLNGSGQPDVAEEYRAQIHQMLQAAEGLGWGAVTAPSRDWRRGPSVGPGRPRIMTLIDELLVAPDIPGFGSQQYRAASAIAHSAPHMVGLIGPDQVVPLPAQEAARRCLPMTFAFYKASSMLCYRMGWPTDRLRAVWDVTIRVWLDTAEPGMSAGLIDY